MALDGGGNDEVKHSRCGDNLVDGGLVHKREMAKVITDWKQAGVVPSTKIQQDAAASCDHGKLASEWTSSIEGI